ncbi:MAG: hypothetical protein ABI992_00970 [Chthoniobacterales bacterium]
MRVISLLGTAVVFLAAGCNKTSHQSAAKEQPTAALDARFLLTPEQVTQVIGSPIKESKSSEQSGGSFRVAQYFYVGEDPLKSVTLTITQARAGGKNPREFWDRIFGRFANQKDGTAISEPETQRGDPEEEEAHEKRNPPKKIDGVGDEAFWSNGQLLYVLKGNSFLRVSVGGPEAEAVRIEKSKALAAAVLAKM